MKVAVLTGSVAASILAAALLRSRNRAYRRIEEDEAVDTDADGAGRLRTALTKCGQFG